MRIALRVEAKPMPKVRRAHSESCPLASNNGRHEQREAQVAKPTARLVTTPR